MVKALISQKALKIVQKNNIFQRALQPFHLGVKKGHWQRAEQKDSDHFQRRWVSPQAKAKELHVVEKSEQKPGCEIRKESGKEGGRVTLPSLL